MKILWHSNAPWVGTGYGQQSAIFGQRIHALGHDFAYSASWGLGGGTIDWEGIPVFPSDGVYGQNTLAAAAHTFGGEECQVITLMDVWPMLPMAQKFKQRIPRFASWVPVDHDPVPPKVAAFFKHSGATAIAMSRFGQRALAKEGIDALYVPHGVETSIFKPQPEKRAALRKRAGLPEDAFVVGMVAANVSSMPPRKAFPQVFQAFAKFRENHPDAYLYLHTRLESADGLNLGHLAAQCGVPSESVGFTHQIAYALDLIDAPAVADIFGMFDVLANPSYGEGFGIPIIEAQACGVPVIVTDHSAMRELCGAGWLVDGDPFYNAPQGSFFKCPSVDDIADAMEQAYRERDNDELRKTAREFALGYDADLVLDLYWKPVLEHLEANAPAPKQDPAEVIHAEAVEV